MRPGLHHHVMAATKQKIDDQQDQQNAADADAATIAKPGITKSAAEQQQDHEDNQDEVHAFTPQSWTLPYQPVLVFARCLGYLCAARPWRV